MKRYGWAQRAVTAVLAGALAACSGGQSAITPPDNATQATHGRSWMSPSARKQDLLYVSDDGNYKVYVYTYPGAQLVGTLDTAYGSPGGMCVDKAGDVFVAEFNYNEILEYAHGGQTPIAVLSDPGQPSGCSIDRRTGNLAVTNQYGPSGGYGNIEIYTNAQGTPQTYYTDPYQMSGISYGAYDDKGNLYIDGTTRYNQFALAEFVKRTKKFRYLTLSQHVNTPGGIEWDGQYIALGDEAANPAVIYQLSFTGTTASVVNTTTLQGTSRVRTFLVPLLGSNKIQGTTVIAPSIFGTVGFYNYPAGGEANQTFSQNQPFAAVVSKK